MPSTVAYMQGRTRIFKKGYCQEALALSAILSAYFFVRVSWPGTKKCMDLDSKIYKLKLCSPVMANFAYSKCCCSLFRIFCSIIYKSQKRAAKLYCMPECFMQKDGSIIMVQHGHVH